MPIYCLNQCWSVHWQIYASLVLNGLNWKDIFPIFLVGLHNACYLFPRHGLGLFYKWFMLQSSICCKFWFVLILNLTNQRGYILARGLTVLLSCCGMYKIVSQQSITVHKWATDISKIFGFWWNEYFMKLVHGLISHDTYLTQIIFKQAKVSVKY